MTNTRKLNLILALILSTYATTALANGSGTATPTPTPAETPVVSLSNEPAAQPKPAFSIKDKKMMGMTFSGYYEINSDYESLYVNFPAQNINAAGMGVNLNFEYGLADRISGEVSMGYSRLLYSSKFRSTIKENFFVADLFANWYFANTEKFMPYVKLGIGTVASGGSIAPTGNVGIGTHFMVADEVSLRAEVLIKSTIIYNRGEGRFGIAYHF